jgi:hypothetical protein
MKSKTMLALAAVTLTAGAAWAPLAAAKPPVANFAVTEAEVLAAQKAWGDALVQTAVLDAAYGYKHGPVLFKPTLTVAPQTFRHTKEGALAYFVGGNKAFPKDDGFALKGWRSVEVANDAIILEGDVAMTQGNVMLTNAKGEKTTVDKTWVYRKDDEGKLRIVVHHSSLPFTPK